MVALLVVVTVLAIAGNWWYGRENRDYQLAEDAMEGGYELPENSYQQNKGKSEPTYFTIQINGSPVADKQSKRCNLMIGNPQENKEYTRVRLVLDKTGEELLYSDLLKPGERNAYVTLDYVPEPGEYTATATFMLFEPDSMAQTSEIEAGVTLTVE